jgi:histone deacetylase complex regulatory component SIN3
MSQFGHSLSGHHVAQAGPSSVQSLGPTSPQDEVLFFERAKRALEARDVYDDFLKLLNMYTRDIIDLKTLVVRAEKFLADDTLLIQFKGLVNWDNRIGNINYGPPGSIRTGPHDAALPRPVEDAHSPSYRRLPDSVSGSNPPWALFADLAALLCPYRRYVWRHLDGTNSHALCSTMSGYRILHGRRRKQAS